MALTRKPRDFAPKKQPSQARARETYDALVDACTQLLPRLGYAGTTTNHVAERAGVNIASLYDYFPGKDAIVAQVAGRLVERVLQRLEQGAARIRSGSADDVVRLWIELIYDTVEREKALIAVFQTQVPYTHQLAPVREIGTRLLEFSLQLRAQADDFVRADFSNASLQLLINLVTSTIMQLVNDPPKHVSRRELLDELIQRVESWIR